MSSSNNFGHRASRNPFRRCVKFMTLDLLQVSRWGKSSFNFWIPISSRSEISTVHLYSVSQRSKLYIPSSYPCTVHCCIVEGCLEVPIFLNPVETPKTPMQLLAFIWSNHYSVPSRLRFFNHQIWREYSWKFLWQNLLRLEETTASQSLPTMLIATNVPRSDGWDFSIVRYLDSGAWRQCL